MAKVGFWLQGATGKLAGSKLQGGVNGTIIADNTKKPKNPKTVNQTLQRVLVNTVSQGYSKLRPICYHAFQGVTEGAKSMFEFQKMNLDYFRAKAAEVGEEQLGSYINFVPVGERGIRPAAFIVANGSLPRVDMTINPSFAAVLPMSSNTYESLLNDYDLQRGDQITFVAICESTSTPGTYIPRFARVILDPRNVDGTAAPLSSAIVADNAINLPNGKNDGNFGLLEFNGGMTFNFKSNEKVCAIACIVSREENGEWKRSFAQMTVNEAAIGEYGVSLSRAITRSLTGRSIHLSSANDYLDNAGVGGGQSTDSGSGESSEQQAATPSFSNTVAFTANNSTFNQSVAGGSVAVTTPLTKIKVSGSNLAIANLEVHTAGTLSATGTVTKVGDDLEWVPENGSAAAPQELQVYKVVGGTSTAWFTVTVQAADDDDPSES